MAINRNAIAIFDTETYSLEVDNTEPVQVAAVILDGRTLAVKDTFESMMNVTRPENITDKALEVNGKTREEIFKAPHPKIVWQNFFNFMMKHRVGTNQWGYPIAAGHNILGFDIPIVKRCMEEHGAKWPFHPRDALDTLPISWLWFENDAKVEKYSLDYIKTHPYFPPMEGKGHDALVDCKYTAEILVRYMKLFRHFKTKVTTWNPQYPKADE